MMFTSSSTGCPSGVVLSSGRAGSSGGRAGGRAGRRVVCDLEWTCMNCNRLSAECGGSCMPAGGGGGGQLVPQAGAVGVAGPRDARAGGRTPRTSALSLNALPAAGVRPTGQNHWALVLVNQETQLSDRFDALASETLCFCVHCKQRRLVEQIGPDAHYNWDAPIMAPDPLASREMSRLDEMSQLKLPALFTRQMAERMLIRYFTRLQGRLCAHCAEGSREGDEDDIVTIALFAAIERFEYGDIPDNAV